MVTAEVVRPERVTRLTPDPSARLEIRVVCDAGLRVVVVIVVSCAASPVRCDVTENFSRLHFPNSNDPA